MVLADLPWWGWLLWGIVNAILGAILVQSDDERPFVGYAFILVGLGCATVAIVVFLKSAWTG